MKRRYSESEIKFIKENYGKIEALEIARRLHRSKTAVNKRANDLGLRLRVSGGNPYLSKRETQVLCSFGLTSYEDIAKKLNISFTTVKTHTNNIYQKLHTHNRHESIVKALKKGIITVNELVEE